jgi:hypothetical protein
VVSEVAIIRARLADGLRAISASGNTVSLGPDRRPRLQQRQAYAISTRFRAQKRVDEHAAYAIKWFRKLCRNCVT